MMVVEAKPMSKVEAVGYVLRAIQQFAATLVGEPIGDAWSEASVAAWREVEQALEQYESVRTMHKGKGKGR